MIFSNINKKIQYEQSKKMAEKDEDCYGNIIYISLELFDIYRKIPVILGTQHIYKNVIYFYIYLLDSFEEEKIDDSGINDRIGLFEFPLEKINFLYTNRSEEIINEEYFEKHIPLLYSFVNKAYLLKKFPSILFHSNRDSSKLYLNQNQEKEEKEDNQVGGKLSLNENKKKKEDNQEKEDNQVGGKLSLNENKKKKEEWISTFLGEEYEFLYLPENKNSFFTHLSIILEKDEEQIKTDLIEQITKENIEHLFQYYEMIEIQIEDSKNKKKCYKKQFEEYGKQNEIEMNRQLKSKYFELAKKVKIDYQFSSFKYKDLSDYKKSINEYDYSLSLKDMKKRLVKDSFIHLFPIFYHLLEQLYNIKFIVFDEDMFKNGFDYFVIDPIYIDSLEIKVRKPSQYIFLKRTNQYQLIKRDDFYEKFQIIYKKENKKEKKYVLSFEDIPSELKEQITNMMYFQKSHTFRFDKNFIELKRQRDKEEIKNTREMISKKDEKMIKHDMTTFILYKTLPSLEKGDILFGIHPLENISYAVYEQYLPIYMKEIERKKTITKRKKKMEYSWKQYFCYDYPCRFIYRERTFLSLEQAINAFIRITEDEMIEIIECIIKENKEIKNTLMQTKKAKLMYMNENGKMEKANAFMIVRERLLKEKE